MTQVLAFYLPQFHETEHNNMWWGKGYTEWTAVRNAKKLCSSQRIPRIPMNNNYYDLSQSDGAAWKWQAELARKYGVDGFVIYHYWFGGQKELNLPAEILLAHPEIDISYSFCWDSNSWRRTWYDSKNSEILVEQNYGETDMWKKHFEDLLPFFKDQRYIKKDNKPVFHIYRPLSISCLPEMKAAWNKWAMEEGFNGIFFVLQNHQTTESIKRSADALYNFEPNRIVEETDDCRYKIGINIRNSMNKHTLKLPFTIYNIRNGNKVLELIEEEKPEHGVYQGTFAGYDDSPRRQKKAVIYTQILPERFEKNLAILLQNAKKVANEFVYINAWNEWGECAYLEPDTDNGYAYLEAVKRAVEGRN